MGFGIRSDRIQREWQRRGGISFLGKKYVFGIFSNESHEFGFGSDVLVVVVGDEEDISGRVDSFVELSRLDKFVESDLGGGFVFGEFPFQVVEPVMELVNREKVSNGDLGVLVVFGQLQHNVPSDARTRSHYIQTHFLNY